MSVKKVIIPLFCLAFVLGLPIETTLAANILYVANLRDAGFIEKDKIVQDYMKSLGHTVIPIDDEASEADTEAAALAEGIDLVYISETVSSGNIKNEITEIDVPMIVSESWAWDEMGMDSGGGGGNDVDSTDITIVAPDHPMIAPLGLSGTIAVLTDIATPSGAKARFARTYVGGDGVSLATWMNGTTVYDVVMIYEKGDALAQAPADGSPAIAANIRIGIGFDERSFELWNENAFLLLEAAINYITRDRDSAQLVYPADGATDIDLQTVCTWIPGETAEKHDVYFGTNFQDVNEASRTDPRGVLQTEAQDPNAFNPGLLGFGTSYYWRVDEVAADNTLTKGVVWSFTSQPFSYPIPAVQATASSFQSEALAPENTVNGSGFNESDLHGTDAGSMWISAAGDTDVWIQFAFDKVYKLDQMLVWNANQTTESSLFAMGVKEVALEVSTNGTDWTEVPDVPPFNQAPGVPDYAANTIVDLKEAVAQFVRISINSGYGLLGQFSLSEVRFLHIPLFATNPSPADDAVDVSPDVILSWGRDGREASSHDIYLGTNLDDLPLVGSVMESRFDTADLDLQLGQTYGWRVDEVNEATTPSTWLGDVWRFTVVEYLVVDGMESYEVDMWMTWSDGYDDPTNGSLVGNGSTGEPEREIVYEGSQSMPMVYGDTGIQNSWSTRTFETPQDWSQHGVQRLVVHFYGSETNTGGNLYVKINDTKVPYDGDTANLKLAGWTEWAIMLGDVAGLNLSSVETLTLGVEGSGEGVLIVDDILLKGGV
ncbi:discoidin domain-containing protein [Planctomycetota bacterium]